MSKKLVYLIHCVLALGLALTSAVEAADPSLVGWWRFDETSGTVAHDSSGYGNNGTLQGGPQWVAGMIGGALSFDGSIDYVEVPDSPSLDIADALTIAVWVRPSANPVASGGHRWLIAKNTFAATETFGMVVRQEGVIANGIAPVGGAWTVKWSSGAIANDVWSHIVMQCSPPFIRSFINGQPSGEWDIGSYEINTNDHNLLVAGEKGGSQRYAGLVDDIRIYNRALSQQEIQQAMMGTDVELASNPSPEDKATGMLLDADLSWEPGDLAVTHDVYFGESFEGVNTATPADKAFQGNQTANTFDPGALAYDKTYFWRIDEVNEANPDSPWKGGTWSFETEPYLFTLPAECIDVIASSYDSNSTLPENTINGSGLDESGLLHSNVESTMWVTAAGGPQPAWIEFTFDKDYVLYEMDVWNHNGLRGLFGIQEARIETATDGGEYMTLGTYTFTQAPGTNGYAANTTVDLGGLTASKVRITAQSGYLDAINVGLSEVQFRYLPVRAYDLTLADGAAGVPVDETLGWRAGRQAVVHEIWLGTDADDLALVDTVSDTQYNLGSLNLTLGQTYYYQIVEVNEAETPATHDSAILSFTTQEYLVVDDFESYKNETFKEIWATWLDGTEFGTNDPTNGSIVGLNPAAGDYSAAPGRGDGQSLPIWFTNTATAPKSEAVRTSAFGDWTAHGIKSLSLWFRGEAGNAGQLYCKINSTKVKYEGLSDAMQRQQWMPWNIDLAATGANLTNVTSLSVGVEGAGTAGVLYLDDMRLYPLPAVMVEPVLPDDNDPNLVAYYPFEGNANDTKGNYPGTVKGAPVYVAGKTGQAIQFDGTDDYIVNDFAQEKVWSAYGVSLWVRTDILGQSVNRSMFNNNSSGADFQLEVDGSKPGNYRYLGITASSVLGPVSSDWVHLAATSDGVQTRVYYNGLLVATLAGADNRFGRIGIGINRGLNQPFAGVIDEVRVYNRALTGAEVAGLAGIVAPIPLPF
jgi:hypothetical protein